MLFPARSRQASNTTVDSCNISATAVLWLDLGVSVAIVSTVGASGISGIVSDSSSNSTVSSDISKTSFPEAEVAATVDDMLTTVHTSTRSYLSARSSSANTTDSPFPTVTNTSIHFADRISVFPQQENIKLFSDPAPISVTSDTYF